MFTRIRDLCWATSLIWASNSSAALAAESPVIPIKVPVAPTAAAAAMQQRLYVACEKELHALLPRIHPWSEDASLRLLTDSKSGEHQIRPNTATVEGIAFLCRFGPYDEKVTGISRADLLNKEFLPMMRYLIATHKTGDRKTSDGKQWGDHWQSAHWAQMLGSAAWLVWDDLPEDCRIGVRRLIAHEADRFVGQEPPHQLHNDTKAEENAWNSQVLAVAAVLMPDDPRRPTWDKTFQQWALSSFLRPADEHSQEMVDGKPMAQQFTGANIFDDFTLENHGIVHPDYMSTLGILLGCARRYELSGRKPPEAILHNVAGIYENLKWLNLRGGGILYPNGQDWELFRDPRWTDMHIDLAVFANDPDAWRLANESLDTLEKMQRRDPNGDVIRDDEAYYPGARMQLFRSMGQAWLTLALAKEIRDEPAERLGVRRLDNAKLILNRTPTVVNSFSWGAKTMAMCVPLDFDRVVSPIARSGIGRIYLEGGKEPLPIRTVKCDVMNDGNSFVAKLVVEHGDGLVQAELEVKSDAKGVMTWHERLVAKKDVELSKVATGLVGVLNNEHWVYEHGERRLTLDGDEVVVPALNGKTVEREASKVTIDSALCITSKQPLRIKYVGARAVEHGRATDVLYLNSLGRKQHYVAEQVISEYEAQISRCSE